MRICSQSANLYSQPDQSAETISQALYGEQLELLQAKDQWSEIRLRNDGYSGYIENRHIQSSENQSTHRIKQRSTPLFTQPDIKSPVQCLLYLGSEVHLSECEHEQFYQTDEQLFVWKQHAQHKHIPLQSPLADLAATLFLEAPYLWGGRTPCGLDCSAVVQLSALLLGWQLPRDTKDQVPFFERGSSNKNTTGRSASSPTPAIPVAYEDKQKNDLVYWPGHVAIMCDAQTVVHATAHSLSCCTESLQAVEARAGKPSSLWRLQQPNS